MNLKKYLALFALRVYKKDLINSYIVAKNNARLSLQEIKSCQDIKFLKLINYAKKNVPYYRTILSSVNISTVSDIYKLPFLTKDIINNKNGIIKSSAKDKTKFIKNSTSGSTGHAMYFYSDKDDAFSLACAIRGDEMSGWVLGDRKLIIWGAERDISKGLRAVLKKYLLGEIIISSYYLDDKTIEDYVSLINAYKPELVVGYPSSLFLIAQVIHKYNFRLTHKIKGMISAGETLFEYQREFIEKIFKTKLLNRYGCREVGHVANECYMQKGLHYNADHLIVEVINEKGEECKTGETGEIVITDLDNYAFPLIRYKIGDMGRMSGNGICTCGSNLPIIEAIEGRKFDIIYGVNGNRISGTFWTLLMRYQILGIEKFQVIQNEITRVNLKLKVTDLFNEYERQNLKRKVIEKLGEGTLVEIEIVKDFEVGPTGKYKWIISKI